MRVKLLFLMVFTLLLLFPMGVMAAPFVVCDPFPTTMNVDGFRIQIDTGAWIDIPAFTNTDGTKQIHYDLGPLNLSTGVHVIKAKAYNIWGEGDESVPFSFNAGKPGAPTTLRLSLQ